mmetsp:Transcript_19193/g.55866  ORF Transcript_19193/g.55866 Transcript_19193/m.55866 type:complete len:438 (+) Transcript_19193:265-1578(+)
MIVLLVVSSQSVHIHPPHAPIDIPPRDRKFSIPRGPLDGLVHAILVLLHERYRIVMMTATEFAILVPRELLLLTVISSQSMNVSRKGRPIASHERFAPRRDHHLYQRMYVIVHAPQETGVIVEVSHVVRVLQRSKVRPVGLVGGDVHDSVPIRRYPSFRRLQYHRGRLVHRSLVQYLKVRSAYVERVECAVRIIINAIAALLLLLLLLPRPRSQRLDDSSGGAHHVVPEMHIVPYQSLVPQIDPPIVVKYGGVKVSQQFSLGRHGKVEDTGVGIVVAKRGSIEARSFPLRHELAEAILGGGVHGGRIVDEHGRYDGIAAAAAKGIPGRHGASYHVAMTMRRVVVGVVVVVVVVLPLPLGGTFDGREREEAFLRIPPLRMDAQSTHEFPQRLIRPTVPIGPSFVGRTNFFSRRDVPQISRQYLPSEKFFGRYEIDSGV